MYVAKNFKAIVIQAMFSEKDQRHETSHRARDIGHFRLNPILFWPDSGKGNLLDVISRHCLDVHV
jgi:hypothetical protein